MKSPVPVRLRCLLPVACSACCAPPPLLPLPPATDEVSGKQVKPQVRFIWKCLHEHFNQMAIPPEKMLLP